MKYYLVAGEASGDLHASRLMQALATEDTQARFRCVGGDKMAAVGGELLLHYRGLAYMGFIPVLLHLRTILSALAKVRRDIVEWKPDVLILIDYPGFNLKLAKFIKANTAIPIYYYISPKIWAWKEWRIKAIRRDIDRMLCILPFEVEWYAKRGYEVDYVGNPTVEEVRTYRSEELAAPGPAQHITPHSSLVTPNSQIAVLPGSRRQEIADNLRTMLLGCMPFAGQYNLLIAAAPGIEDSYYLRHIPEGCTAEIVHEATYRLLANSAAGCIVSGTATLEATLFGLPHVVCYATPLPRLVAWLRRRILKVPFIALENLIAGRQVARELVADTFTAKLITHNMRALLPGGDARQRATRDYGEVGKRLGTESAPQNAAKIIVSSITQKIKIQ